MNSSTRRRLAAGTVTLAATAGFCFAGVSAASAIDGASNNSPISAEDFYSVNAGETLTVSAPGFLGNDFDADGDVLSTQVFFGFDPAETTVNADGSFTITPDSTYPGDRTFFYRAYDGFAMSDWTTVYITVVPAPEPVAPVGAPDYYTTEAGVPLNVPASGVLGNDTPGPFAAVIDVKDVPEGLTPNADGSFSYLPPAGFVGDVSYSYRMTADDSTASDWTLVTITVTPLPPVAPVGTPDNYTTQAGVPLNVPASGVLANDVGGVAVVDVKDVPEGLTPNFDGSFSYIPPADFLGEVSYSYRMSVGSDMLSDWILVTISVTPVVIDEPIVPVVPDPVDPTTPDPTTPEDPTVPEDPTTPDNPTTPVDPTTPEIPTTPVVAQPVVQVATPAASVATPTSNSTELASTGTVSGGLIAPVFALLALGVGLTFVGRRREKSID
ncbi:MAG: Ig-like domain-containing protein [Rhodoglobus sp.]